MKNLIVILIFVLLSCKTFQKEDISISETNLQEAETQEEKNKIIENMYNQKDEIPDNQKKEYIDFFVSAAKDSTKASDKLIKIYNDPNYQSEKSYILENLVQQIDNEKVYSFIEQEILKDPDNYNPSLKQKLLDSSDRNSAELLLNLIYLNKDTLDPEIIYLFKKTKYEGALPILIESIESNKFVEESFSAVAEIPSIESQNYVINAASDYEYPYRNIALSYLYRIDDKQIAYAIYKNILENPSRENPTTLLISIRSLKEIVPYLNESQKKELIPILNPLLNKKTLNAPANELLTLLKQDNLNQEPSRKERNQQQKETTEQKPKLKNDETQISNYTFKKAKIEKKQNQETQNKNIKPKPQPIKQPHKAFYSQKYAQKITKNLIQLFPENYKETQLNLHNALITYARSNSEKSKFVKNAYKDCYKIEKDEEIQALLKEGLFINQSLYCVLVYVKKQYTRKDLQIYTLTQFFAIKRNHATKLIENTELFK